MVNKETYYNPFAIYCTNLIIEYEQTTIRSPITEFLSQAFAFVGSLPDIPAKIYISPDTMIPIVTIVPIKNVAAKIIS